MSQLSAQSIRRLCERPSTQAARDWFGNRLPMIEPFTAEKVVVNGKSYGLSAASYDVRIDHDLTLGVNPSFIMMDVLMRNDGKSPWYLQQEITKELGSNAPWKALANTIESFNMPTNVVGYVCDKSTYARFFVSAFNTLFDPGFCGNATLELVNLNDQPLVIKRGDPICQFTFHWLDKPTDRPYSGKYQNQPRKPMPAILE